LAPPIKLQLVEGPKLSRKLAKKRGKIVSHMPRPPFLPPPPTGDILGTHFCYKLSQPLGHSVAGRIESIKNPNNLIQNRTCDLLACSAVPQPAAPYML